MKYSGSNDQVANSKFQLQENLEVIVRQKGSWLKHMKRTFLPSEVYYKFGDGCVTKVHLGFTCLEDEIATFEPTRSCSIRMLARLRKIL